MKQHDQFSNSLSRWIDSHHSFFVFISVLITLQKSIKTSIDERDYIEAKESLWAAAALLRASTSALRLAGDIDPEIYDQIRLTMEPPHVPKGFSGLLSADHAVLIKSIRSVGKDLFRHRNKLTPAIEFYWQSWEDCYAAHANVCSSAVDDNGSLRADSTPASTQLMKFYRERTINASGCPFHK